MIRLLPATVAVLALAADAPTDGAVKFHFTEADVGKAPAGWKSAQTGMGEGSVWKVVRDTSSPAKDHLVLAQTAEGPERLFNLCVAEGKRFQDLHVQVAFKAMRGVKDQGGGVVWRYRDADNYYIARFNPLEDNYRVYKVVAGKRIQLGTEEGIKLSADEWHTLAITMTGAKIACSLNGKRRLEAADATFKEPGLVGLWTKADAQTYFADFQAGRAH